MATQHIILGTPYYVGDTLTSGDHIRACVNGLAGATDEQILAIRTMLDQGINPEIVPTLMQRAQRAVNDARRTHQAQQNSNDWFNNNTPGVGQTVEYRRIQPLADWVAELALALAAAKAKADG